MGEGAYIIQRTYATFQLSNKIHFYGYHPVYRHVSCSVIMRLRGDEPRAP